MATRSSDQPVSRSRERPGAMRTRCIAGAGILLALAATATGCSRPAPATMPSDTRVAPESVRAQLTALAHDSMQGRRTGTPGARRAAHYIAQRMFALGLEPGGYDGYYQRVPLAQGERRLVLLQSPDALDTIPAARQVVDANVVGIVRGADPARSTEVVIVGAHFDHVGMRAHESGDSIFNGADDDASGVVAMLEIARALQAAPPARTVLFVAFTGEEMGLLGTRWYIEDPPVPLEQVVAQLQIEMIGRPDSLAGGVGRAWLTGYERSTMGRLLAAEGVPIVADPRPEQNFFERSDNIAFARLGIPAHTLSSYGMHEEYHHPDDEVESIDFVHMTAVIEAAIGATRILADGPRVEWLPGGRPAPRSR